MRRPTLSRRKVFKTRAVFESGNDGSARQIRIRACTSKKPDLAAPFIGRGPKMISSTDLLGDNMKKEIAHKSELSGASGSQNDVTVLFLKSSKPARINILGEEMEIRKLNEIPVSVANWLLDHGKALNESLNFIYRNRDDFKQGSSVLRLLKNGWYIEVSGAKEKIFDKTRRLLKIAGLSGDVKIIRKEPDWQSLQLRRRKER